MVNDTYYLESYFPKIDGINLFKSGFDLNTVIDYFYNEVILNSLVKEISQDYSLRQKAIRYLDVLESLIDKNNLEKYFVIADAVKMVNLIAIHTSFGVPKKIMKTRQIFFTKQRRKLVKIFLVKRSIDTCTKFYWK